MPRSKKSNVNNCAELNIILGMCNVSGTQCISMADPQSCPSYNKSLDSGRRNIQSFQIEPLRGISASTPRCINSEPTDVESPIEFVDRCKAVMDLMGIRYEIFDEAPRVKCSKPEVLVEAPDDF